MRGVAANSNKENRMAEVLVGIYGASGFGREVLPAGHKLMVVMPSAGKINSN